MIALVAALTKKGVIGKDGGLPWAIPEELAHFKRLTENHTVIMGRKTFESIGAPLPMRTNIVLSRSKTELPGVVLCHSIDSALAEANFDAFVIGGAEIYRQMIWLADKMYLSYIKEDYSGDTFFPKIDENEWEVELRLDQGPFELVVYKRAQ